MPPRHWPRSPHVALSSSDQSATGAALAPLSTSAFTPVTQSYVTSQDSTSAPRRSILPYQAASPSSSFVRPGFITQPSSAFAGATFPEYGVAPETSTPWEWGAVSNFPPIPDVYEQQGELLQEQQAQYGATEFSTPLPVSSRQAIYQSPLQGPHALAAPNPRKQARQGKRAYVRPGMKRKAESDPRVAPSPSASTSLETQQKMNKRANTSRSPEVASPRSPIATIRGTTETRSVSVATSQDVPTGSDALPATAGDAGEVQHGDEPVRASAPQSRNVDVSPRPRETLSVTASGMLPAGKVFPIQIGSGLFRLSGAAISSDAPSYFSHFFGEQLRHAQGYANEVRTLYIDRDPEIFRDIAAHLQGYHLTPRDGEHFVKLFADAQFYSLPRLTKQLFSGDIYIRIGGVPFQIPRNVFSAPGDTPNYFTLGFAQFFSTPGEAFPGLDRSTLLRPPPIAPPSVPNKDAQIFSELLKIMQGYPVEIRSDVHRAQLLKDARYFHLKGLEQKLVPFDISHNRIRNETQILVRLEDIRQSGIGFLVDLPNVALPAQVPSASTTTVEAPTHTPPPTLGDFTFRPGNVTYARPYTEDPANAQILVLELSSAESAILHSPDPASFGGRQPILDTWITFRGGTLTRISSLFGVIANRVDRSTAKSLSMLNVQAKGTAKSDVTSRVRVRIAADCSFEIDARAASLARDASSGLLGIRFDGRRGQPASPQVTAGAEEMEIFDAHKTSQNMMSEWIWGGPRNDSSEVDSDDIVKHKDLIIKKAQWRLRLEVSPQDATKTQVILCGVKIEAHSDEKSRNQSRRFLS